VPLAITGGIAEGKSTVLEVLRQEGLSVLSADAIVQDLWQRPAVLSAVAGAVGLPGTPTRDDVRRAISGSSELRRRVNGIFHPLVWHEIEQSRAEAVEVPLFIETCLHPLFEKVWVVTCGAKIQQDRLLLRTDPAGAAALLRLQLPTRVKIPFADELIRTNTSFMDVHTQTRMALSRHRKSQSQT